MNRIAPFTPFLLSALILVPLAVVAVVGVKLLHHEHLRLQETVGQAEIRWLTQVASDLDLGMEQVRSSLENELLALPSNGIEEGLSEMRDRNPLVRNIFHVSTNGERILPPPDAYLDSETTRFLQRYNSLFEGRTAWFESRQDPQPLPPPSKKKGGSLSQWANIRTQQRQESRYSKVNDVIPPPLRKRWKTWRWEESDELLLYVEHPNSLDILGIELERSALFSRLDVLLRELATDGEALVMRDGSGQILLASEEAPSFAPGHTVPMGSLLGFAKLEWYPRVKQTQGPSSGFLLASLGIGSLLLLSILSGTLGLAAWSRRSRKQALQKTTFVSNVSHEFKTPLTTLRLYSELLLDGRVKDEDKQQRYLRTLRDESERLARLVHNVLDFSRLEMGRNRMQPIPLSFLKHLQAVQSRMCERLDAQGLRIDYPEQDTWVLADPDGLEQILLNLLDNALKYATGANRVEVRCRLSGKGAVLIEFCDNGPGVPASHRKKIFQAFHQVDESLTRESGGTGLGLHISRRIARQCNGDLSLQPSPKGACFLLTLPKAPHE